MSKKTNQAQLCGFLTRVSSLDSCLSMIILITASLSSKNVQLRLALRRICVWWRSPHATTDQHLGFLFVRVGICDFASSFLLLHALVIRYSSMERNTSVTTSQKSRAGHPSILTPASNEIISDSVEHWDTDVCFLHIQWRRMFDFRKHIRFSPRLILSPQGHQQNPSLGKTQSTMLSRASHMTILSVVTCVV